MPCGGRSATPGRSKKRPSFAGESRAAEDSGYEHKYASTDLMPPDA